MKTKLLSVVVPVLLASSVILTCCSCAAMKHEFYGNPATDTVCTSPGTPGVVVPPAANQLREGAAVVGSVVPEPWGLMVAALMNLLSTGAATIATFHARSTAAANAKTIADAAALPPTVLPPKNS